MNETTWILLGLVALAGVLGYCYWRFLQSPANRWAQQVAHHVSNLNRRRSELLDPAGRTDLRRLAEELFRRHLRSVSVSELARFTGIGPGTVDKVSNAGRSTLADVTDFAFETLPGIGPSKARDLRDAVAALVKEARSRFDAGACPEAQEYRRRLTALTAEDRDRAVAREREFAAIDVALVESVALVDLARGVTFANFLLRRTVPGLTDAVLTRSLPEVKVLPAPLVDPVPPPVAVPVAAPAAAKPVTEPFVLPPSLPVAPPPPTDLFTVSTPTPPRDADPRLTKLRAIVRFGLLVAKADGRLAQAEKKTLRRYLDETFGHDAVLSRHFDPLMEATATESLDEESILTELRGATTDAERAELFALAVRIADGSGERNAREQEMLARIGEALGERPGVSRPSETEVKTGRNEPSRSPMTILEIPLDAELSPELIRRRYALLSEKLDPTKAAALGPEFATMAERKRTELRQAAERLIASFGVPLDPPAAPPPPTDLRHNPDLDDVFG